MTQISLFGKRVTTVDGIKHICLVCQERFNPEHQLDFICPECEEVDSCE